MTDPRGKYGEVLEAEAGTNSIGERSAT